jgi:hypothetical protein
VPQTSCRVGSFLAAACKEAIVVKERYFTIEKANLLLNEADGHVKYWPRKSNGSEFQEEADSAVAGSNTDRTVLDNSEAEHVLYTL